MADTPQQKPAKPESFVGNVMKYSVATYRPRTPTPYPPPLWPTPCR